MEQISTVPSSANNGAEEETGASPAPVDPSTILTRIPRPSTLPRKGILKRSGSVHAPIRRERSSPPQPTLPSATSSGDVRKMDVAAIFRSPTSASEDSSPAMAAGSRIPKLSVTWWETNSVCGEAPLSAKSSKKFSPPPLPEERDRSSDEENDDTESIQSGVSSIAGNWWFGRTTRYVPHCERRHLHGDESGQYLTPTQRKNREIVELKHEVKRGQKVIDDKEKHLQQLRDRLSELERIMDQGGCLAENQRLLARMNAMREEADREKFQIVEQYEEKVKRLKAAYDRDSVERETTFQFEMDELRSSFEREHQRTSAAVDSGLSSSGSGFTCSSSDAWTMTDWQADAVQELQVYAYECMVLRNRVSELEFLMKQYDKDLTADDSCTNKACATKHRGQAAQLEAYKNECLAWRTKAAEMEIALKQHAASKDALQVQVQSLQQSLRQACERQQQQVGARLRGSSSLSSLLTKGSLDDIHAMVSSKDDLPTSTRDGGEDGDEEQPYKREVAQMRNKVRHLEKKLESTKRQLRSTIGHLKSPCAKEQCVNERKRLAVENDALKKENETLKDANESLDRNLDETKRTATERAEMMRTSEQVIQNMEKQLFSKRTELDVTQLTLQKLKEENEKLNCEVQDLNGKLGNLEGIMADCGIAVLTPTSATASSLRRKSVRGGQQQAQLVYRGREVQTDLSWMEEVKMESELKDLLERFAVLQAKYDEEKGDLEMKLDEISQNLHVKNSLVGTLTNQIRMLNDEYEAARAGFERERLQYSQKLHDLDLIAQRVPFLESDVATAREEVQIVESSYEKEKGRFERAMEDSLTESMKSHQQTAEYWKAKLESSVKQAEIQKRKHEQTQRELSDTKMRLNLEKVELENKLQNVYGELSGLQAKLFADRQHQSVQTSVSVEDKGILCYVKTDTKATDIAKGDLTDEREEQLRILQGELHATRRQVEVLQGKLLISQSVHEQLEETDVQKREFENTITELREEIEATKAEARIQWEHFQGRYEEFAVEKERMALAEQKRISELETAFEQVRQELDSVIKRYEEEKLALQSQVEKMRNEVQHSSSENIQLEKCVTELRESLGQQQTTCANLRTELADKNVIIASLEERVKGIDPSHLSALPLSETQHREADANLELVGEQKSNVISATDGETSSHTEPDALMKRYEIEKQKLEDALAVAKQQLLVADDKARIVEMELEYALVDLHEKDRELEAYKAENGSGSARGGKRRRLRRRCRSAGETPVVDANGYQNTLAPEYFILQRQCADLSKQNDRLRQELGILRLDHAMLEINRQQEKTTDSSYTTAKQNVESDELDELKHQLHQAERCAARLETEATQWRNEVASLKGLAKGTKSPSSSSGRSVAPEDKDAAESVGGTRDLFKALKLSEQNAARLKIQLTKVDQECADLKQQLASTVTKQGRLVRKQQEEIDRLRERHENELKTVRKVLAQLQPSPGSADGVVADLRRVLDDTTVALIAKSKELDRLERDVIYLKARLAEVNVKSAVGEGDGHWQPADEFSASSFAAFLDNMKIKHEIELKTLRAELMEERAKRLGTTPASQLSVVRQEPSNDAAATSCADAAEVAVVEDAKARTREIIPEVLPAVAMFKRLIEGTSLSGQEADVLRRLVEETALLLETEKRKTVAVEEKLTEAEKELKMINEELRLKSISFSDEISKLNAENEDLRAKLAEKASNESFEAYRDDNDKMETAVSAARVLQAKVDELVSELEQREKQHQEMYLLMFRKGQEAARLELGANDADGGGSTSSSEWSFEGRGGQAATGEKPSGHSSTEFEQRMKREYASRSGAGLTKDEIALHFLRDAVYYFLVDRDAKDHLQVIMSILKFSERQRQDVLKAKGFG